MPTKPVVRARAKQVAGPQAAFEERDRELTTRSGYSPGSGECVLRAPKLPALLTAALTAAQINGGRL